MFFQSACLSYFLSAVFCLFPQEGIHSPLTKNLKGPSVLTLPQFLRQFEKGYTIKHQIIPARYVECALVTATRDWLKNHPAAALKIEDSQITGSLFIPTLRLPEIDSKDLSPTVLKELQEAETRLKSILHENLPSASDIPSLRMGAKLRSVLVRIDISKTRIEPKVVLAGVYFDKSVRLERATFKKDADFSASVFAEPMNVIETKFESLSQFPGLRLFSGAGFAQVIFSAPVDFSRVFIPPDKTLSFTGMAFNEDLNLSSSNLMGTVDFEKVHFKKKAFFNSINADWGDKAKGLAIPKIVAGALVTKDSVFDDAVYFDDSHLQELALCDPDLHQPVIFSKWVTFAESTFRASCFKDAEFLGPSVFSTEFQGPVDFRWTHFAHEANFIGAEFQTNSLKLSGFRPESPLRLSWKQIDGKMQSPEKLTFLLLEENFRRLQDLDSQNAAYYQRRDRFEQNRFWCLMWGYGVRWWHTLGVILTFVAFFSFGLNVLILLWNPHLLSRVPSQLDSLGSKIGLAGRIAFDEAWRRIPPVHYGSNPSVEALIVGRWLILKVLEVLFLLALSNTSQILKELIPRLYPF